MFSSAAGTSGRMQQKGHPIMTDQLPMRGVLSPVVTPFTADLKPDLERLIGHCRWLLSHDCGLAVFGTNSEGNSLSVEEKIELLNGLVAAGIDPARMMPGTGCCALPDTVRLTSHAVSLGCGGVLMLPPFYYKGVSDEGLYRSVAEVIERVGEAALRIYLYHIPPVAQVGFSLDLIERLITDFPGTVAGIKDSSGDWANTNAMLDRFPGWGVFAGNETVLLETLRHGGMGCISATCNINAPEIAALARHWRDDGAQERQAACTALRARLQAYPMIPALKGVIAYFAGDPDWRHMRPPLVALDEAAIGALGRDLEAAGFDMPGLGRH
jgi:4-hydroxy-tetrahydrodipicolinate synthase